MGVKISELQEKTTANDTDVIPIVDDGTKKITKSNLLKETNEKITNLSTYSTEEVKTGEKWIDGKPIYKKTFTITPTSTSQTTYKHNIANVDVIWLDGDSFLHVGNASIPANYFRNSSVYIYTHVDSLNIIGLVSAEGWLNVPMQITVKYTKTTD